MFVKLWSRISWVYNILDLWVYISQCFCSRNYVLYNISGFTCRGKQNVEQQWWRSPVCFMPYLTHWGRVTHICVNKLCNICSDNCLSPGRRQAIIWSNAGILLIGIYIFIQQNTFENVVWKMAAILFRPQWVISCCVAATGNTRAKTFADTHNTQRYKTVSTDCYRDVFELAKYSDCIRKTFDVFLYKLENIYLNIEIKSVSHEPKRIVLSVVTS